MARDLFSKQSEKYAKYRPGYPSELFEYILQFVGEKKNAWDCATGNGQAALELSRYFENVEATDISRAQLSHARKAGNIHYHICPAENTPFQDDHFDLITVATAYHWLNWPAFHKEAIRVGKNNCVVAVWSYQLLTCDDAEVDKIIRHFYYDITTPYWDKARQHVNESYRNVQFDFEPLPSREFQIIVEWDKESFKGFLDSWSAVQTFKEKTGNTPLALIDDDLNRIWNDKAKKLFVFPLFLRIGKIIKSE